MKKQFIAKLLALALVLSMVPVAVIGASAAGSNGGYYDVYEDTTPVSTTEVDASDVAVENGSAGQEVRDGMGIAYTAAQDQATALLEVEAGTSDAAVIDYLMAAATVGEGTSYADLTYTCELNSEEYGVGFRKESDLVDALNDFFKSAYADGTMQQIADNYGIGDKLIVQK